MLDYHNQEKVTAFLNKIETDYDVEKWTLDHVEVWPFIKISLYFYLSGKKKNKDFISAQKKEKKTPKPKSLKEQLTNLIFSITHPLKYKRFLHTIENKEILFFSHSTYRTQYKGKRFNKFFDSLIERDLLASKDQIYFIERDDYFHKKDLAHSNLILDVRMAYKYFLTSATKQKKLKVRGEDYSTFINSLEDSVFKDFKNKFNKNDFFEFYKAIYYKSKFFEEILKKIRPKQVYLTCYYCNSSFPLTIAAKKLGIEVIEMQHGVMDKNHIPYGVWRKSPINGYKMMPNKVWNWDKNSTDIIEKSFRNINIKPFVGGNPWIDYFKDKTFETLDENFILYSLQPFFELKDLFTKEMIKSINALDFIWYMRLHPRQLEEKEAMIDYLKNNGADMSKINFDTATNEALPNLINQCKIHITQFSSCTIECVLLNKHTYLLHPESKLFFDKYIKNGNAEYVIDQTIYDKLLDLQ